MSDPKIPVSGFETNDAHAAHETKEIRAETLTEFDPDYFRELEGAEGWIALGMENCRNQRYFTVVNAAGTKLGIVGVYDTDSDINISHTVVDPQYRGHGLAAQFKDALMEKLNLPFLTLTISLGNTASLHAAEKLKGVERVSDPDYERRSGKAKFIYRRN